MSERLQWLPGTMIEVETEDTVLLSSPQLGRVWRLSRPAIDRVLEAVDAGQMDDPVMVPLLEWGLVQLSQQPSPKEEWGSLRRYHTWSAIDQYGDGPDESGTARESALANFSAPDVAALRAPINWPGTRVALSEPWATVCANALSRVRANRQRVARARNAAELLYSYGSAHSIAVVGGRDAEHRAVVVADPEDSGWGSRIATLEPIRDQDESDGEIATLLVIGDFLTYQRRYRHEKALRGFMVDGGRITGELERALLAARQNYAISPGARSDDDLLRLGLSPGTHYISAMARVFSHGDRDANRYNCTASSH